MNLGRCAYATMAIREILKCGTSPEVQAALSASCNSQSEETNESEEKSKDEIGTLEKEDSETIIIEKDESMES